MPAEKEIKIKNFLTLRLEGGEVSIYISGVKCPQSQFLAYVVSIDLLERDLKSLLGDKIRSFFHSIIKERAQVALPKLKEIINDSVQNPKEMFKVEYARRMLQKEIIKRMKKKESLDSKFIIQAGYLEYLSFSDFEALNLIVSDMVIDTDKIIDSIRTNKIIDSIRIQNTKSINTFSIVIQYLMKNSEIKFFGKLIRQLKVDYDYACKTNQHYYFRNIRHFFSRINKVAPLSLRKSLINILENRDLELISIIFSKTLYGKEEPENLHNLLKKPHLSLPEQLIMDFLINNKYYLGVKYYLGGVRSVEIYGLFDNYRDLDFKSVLLQNLTRWFEKKNLDIIRFLIEQNLLEVLEHGDFSYLIQNPDVCFYENLANVYTNDDEFLERLHQIFEKIKKMPPLILRKSIEDLFLKKELTIISFMLRMGFFERLDLDILGQLVKNPKIQFIENIFDTLEKEDKIYYGTEYNGDLFENISKVALNTLTESILDIFRQGKIHHIVVLVFGGILWHLNDDDLISLMNNPRINFLELILKIPKMDKWDEDDHLYYFFKTLKKRAQVPFIKKTQEFFEKGEIETIFNLIKADILFDYTLDELKPLINNTNTNFIHGIINSIKEGDYNFREGFDYFLGKIKRSSNYLNTLITRILQVCRDDDLVYVLGSSFFYYLEVDDIIDIFEDLSYEVLKRFVSATFKIEEKVEESGYVRKRLAKLGLKGYKKMIKIFEDYLKSEELDDILGIIKLRWLEFYNSKELKSIYENPEVNLVEKITKLIKIIIDFGKVKKEFKMEKKDQIDLNVPIKSLKFTYDTTEILHYFTGLLYNLATLIDKSIYLEIFSDLNEKQKELFINELLIIVKERLWEEESEDNILGLNKIIVENSKIISFEFVLLKEKIIPVENGTNLSIQGHFEHISEINGLEKLKNLRELILTRCNLLDLTGLNSLINLETLYILGDKTIDDPPLEIKDLDMLLNLKKLKLTNSNISEIKGLTTLTNLEECSLINNKITEIKGFNNMQKLKKLYLSNNKISQIKGFKKLKNLEVLHLNKNQITEITGLEEFSNLKILNLSENEITEIKGLKNLKNLTSLILGSNLKGNNISEIKGLDNLINLKSLDLSANKITEIKGLETLTNLTTLNLGRNNIMEIKSLDNLINLKSLDLSKNEFTEIKGLGTLRNLEHISIHSNKIPDIDYVKFCQSRKFNRKYL